MQTKTDYLVRRLGEGYGVYRRESLGDTHADTLMRRFAEDEFREASSLCKGLRESEPRARLRAELTARAHKTTNLQLLADAIAVLDGKERVIPFGPEYCAPEVATPDMGDPFRPINARIDPVPAGALAAIDGRLDVLDEEVA